VLIDREDALAYCITFRNSGLKCSSSLTEVRQLIFLHLLIAGYLSVADRLKMGELLLHCLLPIALCLIFIFSTAGVAMLGARLSFTLHYKVLLFDQRLKMCPQCRRG
jgi:hypothetical protein